VMAKTRKVGRPKKPKGTGSVSISLRINEGLLATLKEAAAQNGHDNLSQEIVNRLKRSLADDKARTKDRALEALCFVIEQTAQQVTGDTFILDKETKAATTAYSWRSDPFFFRAFKLAIAQVLDALEPRGEIEPPDIRGPDLDPDSAGARWLQSFKTPEARASYAAGYILNSLVTINRRSPEERERQRQRLSDLGGYPIFWREFYGMPDAAADLATEHKSQIGRLEIRPKKEESHD
jgi:hypothetical protein